MATGNALTLTSLNATTATGNIFNFSSLAANVATGNALTLTSLNATIATGNIFNFSSPAANVAVGNVSSLAVATGNVLTLSSLTANVATLNAASGYIANIYTSNIVGFIGSQWTGTSGNPIYYVPQVGIGTSVTNSNLTVTGNVYVSNAIQTGNITATGALYVYQGGTFYTPTLGTQSSSQNFPGTAASGYNVTNSLGTFTISASSEFGIQYAWYPFAPSSYWQVGALSGAYNASSPYQYLAGTYTTSTSTTSYGGEWIQLYGPVKMAPTSIILANGVYDPGYSPGVYVILGNNTSGNTGWTLLATQSSFTTPQTTTITGAANYNYIRIVFTNLKSGNPAGNGCILLTSVTITGTYLIPSTTTSVYSQGNIGIGTTNATASLQVIGNIYVSNSISTTNIAVSGVSNTTTLNVSSLGYMAALNVYGTTNTVSLNVTSVANVVTLNAVTANVLSLNAATTTLTGVTNMYNLQIAGVSGTAGQVLTATGTGSGIQWGTGGGSSQWTGTAGNPIYYGPTVGIGVTSAPASTGSNLYVQGNIYASNTVSTSNLILSGTIYTSAGVPWTPPGASQGALYTLSSNYSLGAAFTTVSVGSSLSAYHINLSLFTQEATQTVSLFSLTSGLIKFSSTGLYQVTCVMVADQPIAKLAVGKTASASFPGSPTYDYVYNYPVTASPSEVITVPINVSDATQYYFLDAYFNTTAGTPTVLYPTRSATVTGFNFGTYVQVAPFGNYITSASGVASGLLANVTQGANLISVYSSNTYRVTMNTASGWTVNGASSSIVATANGNFQVYQTGQYEVKLCLNTVGNTPVKFQVGSLASDALVPNSTTPLYLYSYAPMVTQDPTTTISMPVNLTSVSNIYFVECSFAGVTTGNVMLNSTSSYVMLRPVGSYVNPVIVPWTQQGTTTYNITGSVGIGTTAPAYALDTVGDINASSTLRIGGLIQPRLVSSATFSAVSTFDTATFDLVNYNVVEIRMTVYFNTTNAKILSTQLLDTGGTAYTANESGWQAWTSGTAAAAAGTGANIMPNTELAVGGCIVVIRLLGNMGVATTLRNNWEWLTVGCYAGLGNVSVLGRATVYNTTPVTMNRIRFNLSGGTMTGKYSIINYSS